MALILMQLTTKSLEHTTPETWQSIRVLDPGPHTVDLHVLTRNDPGRPDAIRAVHQGYNMERSRQWAIQYGYEYLFIVQSDIIFPPNTLLALLEFMRVQDAGVVCPLTPERPEKVGTDDFVVCMPWNGNAHAREAINAGQPFQVTGNGSGYMCVLVRRDVFEAFPFPAESSGDIHWYQDLQKAGVKIMCEVDLRLYHKQWQDGVIIRCDAYVVDHWRKFCMKNEAEGRQWCYGLPGRWWWGLTKQKFLEELPRHIDQDRALWSW